MANISTEPDIRVLVGNVGDASPNEGSAKLIRNNLQEALGAKNPVEIHVTITKTVLNQLKKNIESALSGIKIGGTGGSGGGGKGGRKPSTTDAQKYNRTASVKQSSSWSRTYSTLTEKASRLPPGLKQDALTDLKAIDEQLQKTFSNMRLYSSKVDVTTFEHIKDLTHNAKEVVRVYQEIGKEATQAEKAAERAAKQAEQAATQAASQAEKAQKQTDKAVESTQSYVLKQRNKIANHTQSLDANPDSQFALEANALRTKLDAKLAEYSALQRELTTDEKIQVENLISRISKLDQASAAYYKTKDNILTKAQEDLADFDQYVSRLTPKAQLDFASKIADIRTGLDSGDVDTIKKATLEMKAFKAEMKALGYEGGNIFTMLQSKMKQFFVYTLSAGIISGAIRSLHSVINTVKELDAALTDLRIVTGGTKEDTEELLGTYNELAKSLGTTTANVASGATDWLRQGYNKKDTEELLTQSMTLGIVGDMESADATTALTAALKGYQLQVEEASSVVDKFFQVDMEAATSSAKLAEALAKTAANAKLAGLSLDDVIGQLAVVNETMQESGEETGSFYNTMLSRIGGIKAGRLEDPETGEDLSNVETTLRGLDIDLRDQTGQFRNFGEVLDEVGARWKSFSNTQQRAIATAFAGTRQQTRFLALMAGWETAGKYAESAANSTGIAAQKLGVYQESVAAKADKMHASFEAFSTALVDSDLVGWFYDLASGLLDFGTATAPAIQTLTALGGALVGIPTIVNLVKTSGLGTALQKTFTDLGWPEMTGDNIVPIFSEEAA